MDGEVLGADRSSLVVRWSGARVHVLSDGGELCGRASRTGVVRLGSEQGAWWWGANTSETNSGP